VGFRVTHELLAGKLGRRGRDHLVKIGVERGIMLRLMLKDSRGTERGPVFCFYKHGHELLGFVIGRDFITIREICSFSSRIPLHDVS